MKSPRSIRKTYEDLWELLDGWGLSPAAFEAMAPDRKLPTAQEAALLGNAAMAFLTQTHAAVREHCQTHRGVNI